MKSSKKKNICFYFVSKYLNFANITWKTCNRWKEMYLNSPFISIDLRLLTIMLSISTCPPHSLVEILLCLSGLNLMEGKLNKEQWQGSLQNLMMPKLNEWAETSLNPSAKLIQQLCIYVFYVYLT